MNAHNIDFWSWLLVSFIIGLMTLSHLPGLSRIMVLYGLFVAGFYSIYFLRNRLQLQAEVFVYVVWVLWSLSGVIIAVDKELYYSKLSSVIQIAVLVFIVAGITALKRDISSVIAAIVVGSFIVCMSSLVTGEFNEAAQMGSRMRAAGIVGNANAFANQMVLMFMAVLYFWGRKGSRLWPLPLAVGTAISIISIVYSGSRGGILAFIVLVVSWWVFGIKKKLPKNPLKLTIITIILLVGVIYFTDFVLSNTFIGKRINKYDDHSNSTRIGLYETGFNVISSNPIFGIGLDNFSVFTTGLYSHSNYIEVAANTGIVGLLLYYTVYGILFKRLSRLKSMVRDPQFSYDIGLFQATIVTILVMSFTSVLYYSKPQWILLAAMVGYSWAAERHLLSFRSLQK